jgi:amino acid transporter
MTVLFGISFLFFGTMAGNAMNFGISILEVQRPLSELNASGEAVSAVNNGAVRGIAIGVSIAACLLHTLSRRGGILLNNIFAYVKVGMLLVVIITTIIYSFGNGFKNIPGYPPRDETVTANLGLSHSFQHATKSPHGYADAFLDVIYTFAGFEQANYVLGEIKRPHQRFPLGVIFGVGIVSVLYMAVNICYVSTRPVESFASDSISVGSGSAIHHPAAK